MLFEIDVRPTTIIVEVLLAYAFATIVYEIGAMTTTPKPQENP